MQVAGVHVGSDPALFLFIAAASAGLFGVSAWLRARELRRAEYIRTFRFPRGLFGKLHQRYPDLSRKDIALVSRGLRQFFIAYLMSGRRYVAMPSRVVDDLWHEFILYTRDYQAFCNLAFGDFLHHTPAAALDPRRKQSNEGLRRVWWYACKYENINATNPTRLPLLFALDGKLNVLNGYLYQPDCEALRRSGVLDTQCASDFSSTHIDGTLAGFGKPRTNAASGCGGGCGGGSSCGGDGGCGGGD